MVTKIDHIEIIVQHFDDYVAMFRALGFQELTRTRHHGDSVELQLLARINRSSRSIE